MSYGELKIDTITFTSAGVDASVSVSGLVQNPTFTGNLTTTGTISGDVVRGNTVSGATVTGETGEFAGTITASGFIPNGTGVLTNGLYSPATNRVALSTNSTNHFTLTESGVFLFATGVVATGVVDRSGTNQFTPEVQLAGQGSNRNTALSLLHYSSAGFSPTIVLGTSNSNTFGEYTDTVSGRVYGDILFETANETNDSFRPGVLIRGFADHTPGAGLNGVPGALSIQTGPAGQVGTIERMVIASSGNVGIGNFNTDTPDALLELKASPAVAGTPELFISNIGAVTSGNTSSTITFRGGATGSETNIARFTVIADGNDENGGHLAFETTASGGALTEQMRLDSSGNVGIGTTNPTQALQVAGAIVSTGAASTFSVDGIYLQNKGSSVFDISAWRSGANAAVLAFSTDSGSDASPVEHMRIDENGNVGIGTVSPDAKFEVVEDSSGSVEIARMRIEGQTNNPMLRIFADEANQTVTLDTSGSVAGTELVFSEGGAEAMRIDSAGNVGIGTTDPVSDAVLTLSTDSDTALFFRRASGTNQDGAIRFEGGAFQFLNGANSSTVAGLSERMRIDSSGRLLIGTTTSRGDHGGNTSGSDTRLLLEGTSFSTSSGAFIRNSNTSDDAHILFSKSRSGSTGGTTIVSNGDDLGTVGFEGADGAKFIGAADIKAQVDSAPSSDDMPGRLVFSTNGGTTSTTERMRITSAGRVGIGTTNPDDVLDVRSGAAGFSQFVHTSGQGGVRIAGTGASSSANLVFSNNHTSGITDEFTIQMDGSSDDLLFRSGGTGATERMRITDQGRVGVNDDTSGWAELLQVDGTGNTDNQYALALKVGTTGSAFHVRFADTSGVIGSITSNSGTVAYNPFLGCHWARLENGEKIEVPVGTIIETVDKEIEWNFAVFDYQGETKKMAWNGSEKPGETVEVSYEGNTYTATIEPESVDPSVLNKHVCVKVNDTLNSSAVFGVFFGHDSDGGSTDFIGSWNDFYVAAVGNYFIRIAAQETVQIGDLISSDGTGCGVVQATDAITSKTVAKVTSTKKHAVYEDGSYLVTCVLYCG